MTSFDRPLTNMRFNADVYAMRAMPRALRVMLNHGYEEVRVVDCAQGTEIAKIGLPEPDFAIQKCLTGGEGARSYLFSPDELDFAVEIALPEKSSRKIHLPAEFDVPTGLCWFAPSFSVLDCKDVVWTLDGDKLVRADKELAEKLYPAALRKITKRFAVHKISHAGAGLYVRSRGSPVSKVGLVDTTRGVELVMEDDGVAIDFAHQGDRLFVAFDSRIVEWSGGRQSEIFHAGEDEAYLALEVVEADGIALLCVLSATKDYLTGPTTSLASYKL